MTARQRRTYYRIRRQAFLDAGLRHDGKPRVRGTRHSHPDLVGLPPKQRAVIKTKRWLQRERYDKGLTGRGTKPLRVRHPEFTGLTPAQYNIEWKRWYRANHIPAPSEVEQQWQQLRASIVIPEQPDFWTRSERNEQ